MDKKMYILASKIRTAQDIKANKLTHLIIASARIGHDFRVSGTDTRLFAGEKNEAPLPSSVASCVIADDKWEEIAKIKAANPHLKIIVSIGGRIADGFSDMAASSVTRRIFSDSVSSYVSAHNLDGVDIDWEFPTVAGRGFGKTRPQDRENFTALLKALRESIGAEKELSFCASAFEWYLDAIELIETTRWANCVHIMTYGMAGTWDTETRHQANLYSSPTDPFRYSKESADKSVARYIDAGMPPEMLCIGASAYGVEFRGITGEADKELPGLYQKFSAKEPHIWRDGVIPYNILEKYYINKNGYMRYWDEYSKAPYLYSEAEKAFISYEDAQSIREKVRYATETHLGGMICHEYNADANYVLTKAFTSDYTEAISEVVAAI